MRVSVNELSLLVVDLWLGNGGSGNEGDLGRARACMQQLGQPCIVAGRQQVGSLSMDTPRLLAMWPPLPPTQVAPRASQQLLGEGGRQQHYAELAQAAPARSCARPSQRLQAQKCSAAACTYIFISSFFSISMHYSSSHDFISSLTAHDSIHT